MLSTRRIIWLCATLQLSLLSFSSNVAAKQIDYKYTESCTNRELGKAPTKQSVNFNGNIGIQGKNTVNFHGRNLVCNGRWNKRNINTSKEVRNIGKTLGGTVNNLRGESKIKCSLSKNKFSMETFQEWTGDAKSKDKNFIYDNGQMIESVTIKVETRNGSCRITGKSRKEINARKGSRKTVTGGSRTCKIIKSACSFR